MDKESKERPAFAKRQAGGTFVTYAQTNFDSLDERPFGAVDSLVLSWLSYYRLPGRLLREVPDIASWKGAPVGELLRAEYFEEMLGDSWDPDGGRDLLFAVCANPRFRGMRIAGYRTAFDDATEEQFAAATFLLPDGSSYIAFRGTDSTLVGWKEDFNMAFQSPVPLAGVCPGVPGGGCGGFDGPLYGRSFQRGQPRGVRRDHVPARPAGPHRARILA